MKFCNRCGEEISTKDGDNYCADCVTHPVRKTKQLKSEREEALRSLGLIKVRGALGGTYWE